MTPKKYNEFSLIHELTSKFTDFHQIKTGIGDDAAVIDNHGKLQLITTDTLVENDHFSIKWSTPYQIGKKAFEVNVSDIAAMGGLPTLTLVSLVINKNISTSFLQEIYRGIKEICNKYQITLIGGDTTHGTELVISITLLGKVNPENLCLRSHAKTNDLIGVTGKVGASYAGFLALKNNISLDQFSYIKKKHLEPQSRLTASQIIAPYANAMIDVSDGVASEVRHIAQNSKKGAIIYTKKLPINPEVDKIEQKLKLKKNTCALSGGEDFELLFTITEENVLKLQNHFQDFTVIGKILADPKKLDLIDFDNQRIDLPFGYDHLLESTN